MRKGVEASAEIQGAARSVSEENKRLREILKQKGVEEEELNAFLAGNDHDIYHSGGPMLDILLRTRKVCDGSLGPSNSNENTIPKKSEDGATQFHQPDSSQRSKSMQSLGVSHTPSYATSSSHLAVPRSQSSGQEFSMTQSFDDLDYELDGYEDEVTGMTCADAANIVAAMDPSLHRDKVATDLGCTPGSSCKVDNSTIFEIMDKYAPERL
jgi:hypothetical protein